MYPINVFVIFSKKTYNSAKLEANMTNTVHQSNSIAIPLFVLFLITSISALTGSLMLIPNKENIILYFLLFILLILIVLSIFVFIKSRGMDVDKIN